MVLAIVSHGGSCPWSGSFPQAGQTEWVLGKNPPVQYVPPTHHSARAVKYGGRLIAIHVSARWCGRRRALVSRMNAIRSAPSDEISDRSEERRVGKECRSRWA